jgi:serine/threonine protein kinase, bacterial
LPFNEIHSPGGVAVDTAGAVYVASYGDNQVLKLPAGSNTQVTVPFTGLRTPEGTAVDSAGNIYVASAGNNRVLKLPAGSDTPVELPFTDLDHPYGVAVNSTGDVYVADYSNGRVLKLPAGADNQVELPFTGFDHLNPPNVLSIDSGGNIYVVDQVPRAQAWCMTPARTHACCHEPSGPISPPSAVRPQ